MRRAHQAAIEKCVRRYLPGTTPKDRPDYAVDELPGLLLLSAERHALAGDDFAFIEQIGYVEKNAELDRFDREHLGRWLAANGLNSAYKFESGSALAVQPRGRWPWGDHHTEALGHLEAAAKKWWVNFDPSDKSTASTNVEVANWLIKERGISKKLAESIASILRADGLPTGPR
jgi:hypothetical protein